MAKLLILSSFCALLSAATIYITVYWAKIYKIADHPGGHKNHICSRPFVGGVGILAALCVALSLLISLYPAQMQKWLVLGFCAITIFITGFTDDIAQLSYKIRIFIQLLAAIVMVVAGGIVLNDLGELFYGLSFYLGLFAIPFTIFATVGGLNIINMMDGADGLSGSLSMVSLLWLAIVAYIAGDTANLFLIVALIGGVAGFLIYNLPISKKPARVFLGDNGSMLLGLIFAWLLIDLSQGQNPAMTPVTALWILVIPLMDAISVMYRRLRANESLFKPDRKHLHHLLLKAGYRVEEVVFAIVSIHTLLGLIGLAGLYFKVPDFVMMLSFLLIYMGYFYLTLCPWFYIPALCFLHTRLRLTPHASRGTFVGNYTSAGAEHLALKISSELKSGDDFWIQIFRQLQEDNKSFIKSYALALYLRLPNDQQAVDAKINKFIPNLKQRLKEKYNIQMRFLVEREEDTDLIISENENFSRSRLSDRRKSYRRSLGYRVIVFEITSS